MKLLGFEFGSQKPITQPSIIEKVDSNIYAVNSFHFANDNTFIPSYYNTYSTTNGYVRYGDDNLFPNKLVDLFYSSPLHNTAIKLKSKLINGSGVEVNTNDVKTQTFIDNINGSDNIEKLISEISLDYKLFGSYHLLITWNNSFTKIIKIERLPTFGVRYGVDAVYNINSIFYSLDWLYRKNTVVKYPIFNVLDKTNQQQVYIVKNPNVDNRIYSIPDYASGLNSIAANAGISLYQLSVIENGFNPGLVVKFYKKPSSQEEKEKVINGIKKEYGGKKNAGKVMIMFSDGKDLAPDVQPVDVSNLDKQFSVLTEDLNNNIIYSHNIISPLLLGVKTAGQLGNNQELQNAFMLLEKTLISSDRKVIEDSLNKFLKLNGMNTITIKPFVVFEEQINVQNQTK